MFRKKLKEMLNIMGMTDIDDEVLDSLQRQLFQFLEFDDSLAGGITFKTGSILTTIQVQNYQEINVRSLMIFVGSKNEHDGGNAKSSKRHVRGTKKNGNEF